MPYFLSHSSGSIPIEPSPSWTMRLAPPGGVRAARAAATAWPPKSTSPLELEPVDAALDAQRRRAGWSQGGAVHLHRPALPQQRFGDGGKVARAELEAVPLRRGDRPQAELEQAHQEAVLGVEVAPREALVLGVDHRRPRVAGAHLHAAVDERRARRAAAGWPTPGAGSGSSTSLGCGRAALARRAAAPRGSRAAAAAAAEQGGERLLELLGRHHHLAASRAAGRAQGGRGGQRLEAGERLGEEHEGVGGWLGPGRGASPMPSTATAEASGTARRRARGRRRAAPRRRQGPAGAGQPQRAPRPIAAGGGESAGVRPSHHPRTPRAQSRGSTAS